MFLIVFLFFFQTTQDRKDDVFCANAYEKCTDFENWEIETTMIYMCRFMLKEMIRVQTLPKSQFVVKLQSHLFRKILRKFFSFSKNIVYIFCFWLFFFFFFQTNVFLCACIGWLKHLSQRYSYQPKSFKNINIIFIYDEKQRWWFIFLMIRNFGRVWTRIILFYIYLHIYIVVVSYFSFSYTEPKNMFRTKNNIFSILWNQNVKAFINVI